MPFRKHVKITFTNEDKRTGLADLPDHVCGSRRARGTPATSTRSGGGPRDRANPDYTIVDGIKGKGKYAGTFLAWTQLSTAGSARARSSSTSTGIAVPDHLRDRHGGLLLRELRVPGDLHARRTWANAGETNSGDDGPPKWSLYRWHIMDPICFDRTCA